MTDDLEAQVRKFLTTQGFWFSSDGRIGRGLVLDEEAHRLHDALIVWARRLVAESRAGALREALPYMVHQQLCAVIGRYDYGCTCGRSALAAEAEPGA